VSSPASIPAAARTDVHAAWFAAEPDPVLTFLHAPVEATPQSSAVLLCPPFGWEEMSAHRALRSWADALASAGFPAARFDLPGAGDSGGSPRDPARLEAWTDAVTALAEWLREVTGVGRIAVAGIGLGGLLACRALARGARIDDLILWAVSARGRTLLRELRAYAGMIAARYPQDIRPESLSDGDFEAIGFLLSAETVQDIEKVELSQLPGPSEAGRRVLLLGRDGLPVDRRLLALFKDAGAGVSIDEGSDYDALVAHPQEGRCPVRTIERTITWLEEVSGPSTERQAEPGPRSSVDSITVRCDERAVRETILRLSGETGQVFGLSTEPVEADRVPICAVWLNGGALHHIGPNRVWVEVARRWAARGVASVRVDLHGIGESSGEDPELLSNPSLYDPARTRETLAILDQLAARGIGERFILGGLCSGAYWALQAALADARVAGALMINLYAFFWTRELVGERDTQHSLNALQGRAWRRVIRGQLSREQIRAAARSVSPARLRAGAGHPVERAQSAEIERALDRLRDQQTYALLLLSQGEGLRDQLLRQGVLPENERWPNLVCEEIPSRDHMFRALWLQRQVHASLDRALDRVLDRELDRAAGG
jgi:alpha-beta hydrolase superfamily lysophospholipase